MAIELGVRGDETFSDYVRVLTKGWGTDEISIHDRPIVGKVNTVSGLYTPPELLDLVKEFEPHNSSVQEALAEAKYPLSESRFREIGHKVTYSPPTKDSQDK